MNQKLPNFFIVGAAKAGTTSLYNYLQAHPDVFLCPIKEPNYFSTDINPEDFNPTYRKNTILHIKDKPKKKIQLAFVRNSKLYLRLFEDAQNEKAIGECSTSYLFSSVAAKNIKVFNPEAKIIIALRNPVERTFSHYLMAVKYGFTHHSFSDALQKDMSATEKGWGISELFIELSLYYEQLKRFYDVFPRENIKVLFFDDLQTDPAALANDICKFLDIDTFKLTDKENYNPAALPRFKCLNSVMVKTGFKNFLMRVFPRNIADKAKSIYYTNKKLPEMKDQDQAFLKSIFKEDIKKTQDLIRKDLTHWL